MESRETELCNKLYKNEEEQQIFLGFQIFAIRTHGKSKQSKIFLDFSNIKPKIRNRANRANQS
jgi:fatty acid/phospholipid biosynthesis enzyme